MRLYHTGYQEIREPDVHFGRKNADFGQGFYLTGDREFACRWAKEKKGMDIIVNTYDLDETGLLIHRFSRTPEWFDYIFANRTGKKDTLEGDVVIGPIANDTIYNTFGMITSGYLSREEAMQLLLIGPLYEQIALKTEKAAGNLKWISAEKLTDVQKYSKILAAEEAEYQELFAETMRKFV